MLRPETVSGSVLHAWAPAKVNLYLHVVGKRGDGLHLLESLVVFVDLCDRLQATPANDFSLNITGLGAEELSRNASSNLVLQAAEAWGQACGISARAAFELHKEIPLSAGLGGGSTDAAAALRLCGQLWDRPVDATRNAQLIAGLGSDVPACVSCRPAIMRGVGEQLEYVTLPHFALLLVNPHVAVETRAVYGAYRPPYGQETNRKWHGLTAVQLAEQLREYGNDLQAPAIKIAPEINQVLARLAALPGALLARMSGSGATCFAMFETLDRAQAAANSVAQEYPHWWVKACETQKGEER